MNVIQYSPGRTEVQQDEMSMGMTKICVSLVSSMERVRERERERERDASLGNNRT